MAKIYCIANQKGGVGKTTTAVNLAAALSQLSFNVLLVDLDPQGNATTGSGLEKNNLVQSVYEVLLDRADIKKVITHSTSGYDILGSNRKLAAAEEELLSVARKELRLKTKLDEVSGQYDVIIIVGKTTTAVNLAAALSQLSFNVLLVDLDPQGNATTGSGLEKNNLVQSVYEVLLDRADIKKVITHSTSGYDILGSNRKLAAAEEELLSVARKELRLKTKLDEVSGQYDVIIIDCPPTLSILTINAFCAADGLIIPMTCEYYSLEGVSDLLLSIRAVREQVNSGLVITGLLRVKFDPRITLQREVSEQLSGYFGSSVFSSVIPTNVRLAEAPSYGLSGIQYDPSSRGAVSYKTFAEELVKKDKLKKLLKNRKREG